jgi:uncharacterized RDD family membrane protein YckC
LKLDPLLEELIVAAVAMTALGAIVAALFWVFTGLTPWPFLVLSEIGAFGFGIVLLAVTTPKRSR